MFKSLETYNNGQMFKIHVNTPDELLIMHQKNYSVEKIRRQYTYKIVRGKDETRNYNSSWFVFANGSYPVKLKAYNTVLDQARAEVITQRGSDSSWLNIQQPIEVINAKFQPSFLEVGCIYNTWFGLLDTKI